MVADGRNDFCLSWLLLFLGQGAGSDWQAQRQSAISGSGGDSEFLGRGTLAVFFVVVN